jgi:hypothetical protein
MIGGAVVGAAGSAYAGKKAADAATESAQISTDATMRQYEQNRADMMPWRDAGLGALEQLKTGTAEGGDFNRDFTLADFQKDPGYQFRMDEGRGALEGSAAARGGLLTGGTLKALSRYGQDYASGEYTNAYNRFNADRTQRFNRLSGLAGTAQTATRDVAQQGTAATSAANEYGAQAANARGSQYVGAANAVNQGASSLANFYSQQAMINSMNKTNFANRPTSDSITMSDGNTFAGAYPS